MRILILVSLVALAVGCKAFKPEDAPLTRAEAAQLEERVKSQTGQSVREALASNHEAVRAAAEEILGTSVSQIKAELDGSITAKLPPLALEVVEKALAAAAPKVVSDPSPSGLGKAAVALGVAAWSAFRVRQEISKRKGAPKATPPPEVQLA